MQSIEWLQTDEATDILDTMGKINVRKYENKRGDLIKLIIQYLLFDTHYVAIMDFRKS